MKVLRVFAASPSDMHPERERLEVVIAELNRTVAQRIALRVELVRWENYARPDLGRPQAVINAQMPNCDIFVGLLWKRFGTPTGKAESGTEEEFTLACARREKSDEPKVMLYFKQEHYTLRSEEDADQIKKVLAFRQKVSQVALIWDFYDTANFESYIRQHLIHEIFDRMAEKKKVKFATVATTTFNPRTENPKKEEFFERLGEKLPELIGTDSFEVIEKLKARESVMSTGAGFGIANPHTYTHSLDQHLILLCEVPNGIDWDALDNKLTFVIGLCVFGEAERIGTPLRILAGFNKLAYSKNELGMGKDLLKLKDCVVKMLEELGLNVRIVRVSDF